MSYVLFISEEKLKNSTAIGGAVDMDFILPYLKTSQRIYLEPKLGTRYIRGITDQNYCRLSYRYL